MDPQVFLLPLCIALTVVGLIVTALTWRFSKLRGRILQAAAATLVPVGLYLTGLLLIVWNFVAAIVGWVGSVIFAPVVWVGVGFIGLAVLLWVIGAIVNGRAISRLPGSSAGAVAGTRGQQAREARGQREGQAQAAQIEQSADSDPEMDEIEALLRRRGIE